MCVLRVVVIALSVLSLNCFANTGKLPELACVFEMQTEHEAGHEHEGSAQDIETSTWRMWRYHNKVQISHTQAPVGEVWQLMNNGELKYTWLFHKEKFAINYEPTDLKSIQNNANWQAKASMISPDLLKHLNKTGTDLFQGEVAEHYQGKVGAYELEIIWLPKLQLPAMIKQHKQGVTHRVQLKHFYPVNEVSWKAENYNDYDDIDFSDIGDNEANPILKKYMTGMSLSAMHQH